MQDQTFDRYLRLEINELLSKFWFAVSFNFKDFTSFDRKGAYCHVGSSRQVHIPVEFHKFCVIKHKKYMH